MTRTRSADALRAAALSNGPDPFVSTVTGPETERWIYGPGQYEAGTLERLVAEGFAANRFVHYTRNYARAERSLTAQHGLTGAAGILTLTANGDLVVDLDQERFASATTPAQPVALQLPAGARLVTVTVTADPGPATFAVLGEGVLDGTDWLVVGSEGVDPHLGQLRPGGTQPPHLVGEPIQRFAVTADDTGLIDVGTGVLGRVVIDTERRPIIRSGESEPEARSRTDDAETSHDLRRRPDGSWASVHQLGFRYLTVEPSTVARVHVETAVRPATTRGAFVCSDEILNRIWSTAAYTLRCCMQRLMLDGIKRDRMPWIGDQALSTIANAYAFGDGQIVRDSLTALGHPRSGYVNGISDYSLWWVITQELHQRYFDDRDHLRREADHLHRFVADLAVHATSTGMFRPPTDPDGFGAAPGSALIDWGVTIEPGEDYTGLQMLWFWALRSATALLDRAGHPGAQRWSALAETLEETVQSEAWDSGRRAWTEYVSRPDSGCSYPNFLAVLSGIRPPDSTDGVTEAIEHGRVGTPFMTAFALRALSGCGRAEAVVERIRRQWGAMLDAGATTFWEEFDHTGEAPYNMYGRAFGKSLCHAWGAGPAAVLPETVLGLRPLADGWRRFEVRPRLGDLDWAAAVVPVPGGGAITVVADRGGTVEVHAPPGFTSTRVPD